MRSLLLLLVATLCAGYNITLHRPVLAGKSSTTHFWRPHSGVAFSRSHVVFKVHRRGHNCDCDGEEAKGVACPKTCETHSVLLTVDGGETFHTSEQAHEFCGTKSLELKDGEGKIMRRCPVENKATMKEGVVEFPQVDWTIDQSGETPALQAKESNQVMTFYVHGFSRKTPVSARLGDNLVTMKDKQFMFRLGHLKYDDEEVTGLFKSQDNGTSWFYVSKVAVSLGDENKLDRPSETGLRVYAGENGEYVRVSSESLGRKWTNVSAVSEMRTMPTVVSSRFVSVMVGGQRMPILYVMGAKKSDSKMFYITSEHNQRVDEEHKYPSEYEEAMKTGTFKDCHMPPFKKDNSASMGCGSSGIVDVVSLGSAEDNQNVTDFLMCYDKLADGWNGPDGEKEDAVYCKRASVNETAELIAHERKLRRQEEQREAERKAYERARKQQEEARARRRQEKKEKERRDRERLAQFAVLDEALFINPAREQQKLDGELVIVRDIIPEWADAMADSVGMPLDNDQQ